MQPEPTDKHRWLHHMVGEWTYEGSTEGTAGCPAMTWSGRERVKKMGDLWVVAEATGSMPGECGEMTYLMTLGYDAMRARFTGSFACSASDFMYGYDGALRDGGQVLVLDTEGPDFEDPSKLAKYQDVIRFEDSHTRVMTSHTQNGDGGWEEFMRAVYRRTQ